MLWLCRTMCAARPHAACRRWWWWWWCGATVLAAAASISAAGGGGRRDVFDYLEGVGTTLDLNDRRGKTLRRLLRRLAKPETVLAEDEAEEEERRAAAVAAATSFFAANKFTLKMPPHIHPRRRRRRRHTEEGADAVPVVLQDTVGLGEAGKGAGQGALEESVAGVGRQEDAVSEVKRRFKRKRLDASTWKWQSEVPQRPRVEAEALRTAPTVYLYPAVVAVCLLSACWLACCMTGRDGSATFVDYAGQCTWFLGDFMHCKDLVVSLKRYLWRFETVQGVQHDDLLVYVAQELQEVHDSYQRQVLDKVGDPRRPPTDDQEYLDREMAKLRRRKRGMRRWGWILGM